MNNKKHRDKRVFRRGSSILDDIRQLIFPAEFRIATPVFQLILPDESQTASVDQLDEQQAADDDVPVANQLAEEFATCLWYLKTKHFRRQWDDAETDDDDPRVRRALNRLNKSIEILEANGIEVNDPVNKRYPQGGEGTMRPIQFLATAGLMYEIVSETVAPIIYRDDRLIQRGEVFVAVPKEDTTSETESGEKVSPTQTVPAEGPVQSTSGLLEVQSREGDTEHDTATQDNPHKLPTRSPDASDCSDDSEWTAGREEVHTCSDDLLSTNVKRSEGFAKLDESGREDEATEGPVENSH